MRKQLGFALAGIVFASVANATSFIIDPFADTQQLTTSNSSNVGGADLIGGHRYASINLTGGSGSDSLNINLPTSNILDLSMSASDTSDMRLLYDGTSSNTGVNAFGLTGIDFTQLGALSLIRISMQSDHTSTLTLKAYTDAGNFSTAIVDYTAGFSFNNYDTPFTSFVPTGSGADFTNVKAFEVTLSGVSEQDVQMDFLSAESSSAPEPSTMLLLGGGLVGLGVFSRRRRRS